MQPGSEAAGGGKDPTASASSSAVAGVGDGAGAGHPGFESIHHQQQQQQQLLYRQLLQQTQQQRKAEGEASLLAFQSGSPHGALGGSNFPSSSTNIPLLQPPAKFSDGRQQHGAPQLRQETQNNGQGVGQHVRNPPHQAHLQYALQAAQQRSHVNMQVQQEGKVGMAGPSWRGQDMLLNNLKMQDLMSLQAAKQRSAQSFAPSEKQMEQGNSSAEQRSDLKPPQVATGNLMSANMTRPVQSLQSMATMPSAANSQLVAQLQAMQTWAREHNIDPSQVLPLLQSAGMAGMVKPNETNTVSQQSHLPCLKQQHMSSPAASENSAHGNSSSDHSGQARPVKSRQMLSSGSISSSTANATAISSNIQMQQHQPTTHNRENQNDMVGSPPGTIGNGAVVVHLPPSSGVTGHSMEHSGTKIALAENDALRMQHSKAVKQQVNRLPSQPAISSSEVAGNQTSSQGEKAQMPQQHLGFTKQQLHVLKAQILAFRRIKRGERVLPDEVLHAIEPPPLDLQLQQSFVPSRMVNRERSAGNNVEGHARHAESNGKAPQFDPLSKGYYPSKDGSVSGEEKAVMTVQMQGALGPSREHVQMESIGNVEQSSTSSPKSEPDVERGSKKISIKVAFNSEEGKAVPLNSAIMDDGQVKKPAPTGSGIVSKDVITRKYHGPLFDFPSFTRRHDSLALTNANYLNNLTLSYDVNDLLLEEGVGVLKKKRMANLKKLGCLLALNLERKSIRPDIVLRMQIEEKKLRLFDLQCRVRQEVDQQQQEIMTMSDRSYRKFVKECERQRIEFTRQVQHLQKLSRANQLKSIFQWRKKLLEAHWAIRDARTTRNRGVGKYHERMLREFSKRKDEDRNKRMEALKNNDVDRYREMLLEQQTNVPGDAAQRYAVLSSFLSQTEEYLHKLGGKITAAKNHQEVVEAANVAAVAARSQGLSEEEVKAAAACAREEVMIRNRFSEMNATKDSSSANKYYNLAHAVNERVVRQPLMLRAGTLRDYQLIGLQWMLSLYNNKLNGILADEMGLGKTVQVMALIAYLMEFKGNNGPHLIIVPNAVLVNWKSELLNWLPSVSCIFYVGGKDQRSKLFSQVRAVKFNVLVTTYEFVMYDRSKLSKIEWKYIIIDEAQRMKDRESVLARDLDRYRCHRRLLLTGTPLQNDLKELWSLLNLLLPEVFDNSKAFHDWFSKPFQKDGPSHSLEEDDWLETEKKVIVIHRLHQILEPFMLRRRVEDVEGSLPRKVSVVLRCRMSAIQSAIYDWIKSTGTIRVDPEEESRRAEKNPMYQVKMYKNLNNKCMELRKVCNHPLLSYPYFNDYSKDFIVRSCGKLWILDRILIKLHRAGHRVLLFSTMTKLLDILEEYLQWRQVVYRRIDGTTSLEDRESAIVDFNSSDSDCFIFLLSIRAAGRGLNLQTADTVVIYDPDPNPQNEEQAVARAHRIGQKREVKVIYMEAVVDKISSYQKEDERRNGGTGDSEDELAGKDRYVGSIESLIRNNIQQYKIDMADEVINAGRFDQRTTHEERRMTLETLLHDEERCQASLHDVPSLQEVNRLIARSEEEIELFDQMDEELDWTREMVKFNQVPKWLRAGSREVNVVTTNTSKKASRNNLAEYIGMDSGELSGLSPSRTERRRGRLKGSASSMKYPIYRELDDDVDSITSSERNTSLLHEEEGEMGDFEDDESNDAIDVVPNNKDQFEEEGFVSDGGGYGLSPVMEASKSVHLFEDAGSSGSFVGSRLLPLPATPSISLQKFGSLSALDARPGPLSKRMPEELEEGEIAVSGDSQANFQPPGSCVHNCDDGESQQILQPKLKRKRSIRVRPRHTVERLEEKSCNERPFSQHGLQLPLQGDHDNDMHLSIDPEFEAFTDPTSHGHDVNASFLKQRRSLPLRKVSPVVMQNSGRLSYLSESAENPTENSRKSRNSKAQGAGAPSFLSTKMSDSTQRKCKNVISKFQRRIDKDGHQLIPILYDLWKWNGNSSFATPAALTTNLLDLKTIEHNVDSSEYNDVINFIADVQLMLKNVVRQCNYSYEVRHEAIKLHDLFFDIMKIAFPDMDFRETRNTVTFCDPGGATTAPSPKQTTASQNKQHSVNNEVELDLGPTTSKSHKESIPGNGSARDQVLPEGLPHLRDLVICKKRRNDRDKSAMKQRLGPISPSSQGPLGSPSPSDLVPVSPRSTIRTVRVPFQQDIHPTQQAMHPTGPAQQPTQRSGSGAGGSLSVGDAQWAKPVKRMRTDTGRRRPSHL